MKGGSNSALCQGVKTLPLLGVNLSSQCAKICRCFSLEDDLMVVTGGFSPRALERAAPNSARQRRLKEWSSSTHCSWKDGKAVARKDPEQRPKRQNQMFASSKTSKISLDIQEMLTSVGFF